MVTTNEQLIQEYKEFKALCVNEGIVNLHEIIKLFEVTQSI